MRAPIADFADVRPATDCLDLLPEPVAAAVRAWRGTVPADSLRYVDSDPAVADTSVFVETHGPELLDASANCVIVAGRRGETTTLAACVVRSATRVDVNGVVRKELGSRKVRFAPADVATGDTGMEYGGITPLGLPEGWPVLVDATVVDTEWVLVGSGRRRGKLILPGKAFAELPGAVVLEGLGVKPEPAPERAGVS